MQKENYHKDVNKLFETMIKNLTVVDFNEISFDSIKLILNIKEKMTVLILKK